MYANLNPSFIHFGHIDGPNLAIKTGIRFEKTHSIANAVLRSQFREHNYGDWFPSISLDLPGDKNSWTISYNRRIDRPGYQQLNPFLYFIDPFTYLLGNALLQPQYTDKIELAFVRGELSVNTGVSRTKNAMTRLTTQSDTSRIIIQTYDNLQRFDNVYLTVTSSYRITKWWSSVDFATAFYNHYQSGFLGGTIDNEQLSFRINSTQTFDCPAGIKTEFSFNYRSPYAYGITRYQQVFIVNAGIQKNILNDRLSLKFIFSNIFNTGYTFSSIRYQNQDVRESYRVVGSRFMLTASYSFGKPKGENRKTLKSAAEEERGRVN